VYSLLLCLYNRKQQSKHTGNAVTILFPVSINTSSIVLQELGNIHTMVQNPIDFSVM